MLKRIAFKGGLELNFFLQREFESLEDIDPSQEIPILARNLLRFFTQGWTESWTQFLTPIFLYAFFIQRNPELLREIRFAMQQGFFDLFKQLQDKNLNEEQREQVQLYLSNCLSILPYGDLNPYESFQIPQYINGYWELVEYQVNPIELTSTTGWRRFFIYDHDRVFAYGLKPLYQTKAESHLIFMGTTYPAGQGFLTQVKTDSKGFESVGKSLYCSGREGIQKWLSQQENTIHVCGISLGGSLSLLLAIDKGNYQLSRIDALNPAGLYEPLFQSSYDYWDDMLDKPKVVVQKQGNDPVSTFGLWKEDWDILQVTPPKDKKGSNFFWDHCLNYAGFADTEFQYIDAVHDNAKRSAYMLLLNALTRSLAYCALLPFTYVLRPLIYFAKNRVVPESTNHSYSELAMIHYPSLPRNATMDIYNVNNSIEIDLTYQQINTYYQVTRCLVQGKNFFPDKEKESKHVKGINKKTLLKDSCDTEKADIKIHCKVTKAKAIHICHTLTLVHQLGMDNKERLKHVLEKNYSAYRLGKQ